MNICLLETQEQLDVMDRTILEECTVVALTPFAMAALDRERIEYKISTSYAPISQWDEDYQSVALKAAAFCKVLDQGLRVKNSGPLWDDEGLEPCFWMNKSFVSLFTTSLFMTRLLDTLIQQEQPEQIYYFFPKEKGEDPERIGFANSDFLSEHVAVVQKRYPGIEWTSFEADNECLNMGQAHHDTRSRIRCHLAALAGEAVRASRQFVKDHGLKSFAPRTVKRDKGILILCKPPEIEVLIKPLSKERAFWFWTGRDDSVAPVSYELLSREVRLSAPLQELKTLSRDEFRGICAQEWGEDFRAIEDLILEHYPAIERLLKSTFEIYQRALEFFSRYDVDAVFAGNGAIPAHNAIMTAARRSGVRSVVFQHGGTYGMGHLWSPQNQCYYFPDYFALWGRESQKLIEKRDNHRCRLFFSGRYAEKRDFIQRQPEEKKKVLLIPNDSYKGHTMASYSQCWSFRLEKKLVDLFKQYSQHEFILKPTPKHRIRDVLREYWVHQLPGAEIIESGGLTQICAGMDCTVQTHLGTTLLDAFRAQAPVIGLRRQSYGTYYPEVEEDLKRACVYCHAEDEFLENVENYLRNLGSLPDFSGAMKLFNDKYCCEVNERVFRQNIENLLRAEP